MTTRLEAKLMSVSPGNWKTGQAVVFDWYDGPREGVCSLKYPEATFFFELLDERATQHDLDDRLLGLSYVPDGTMARVITTLSALGPPTLPLWVPIWDLSDKALLKSMKRDLDVILVSREPAAAVIHTRDMERFFGCWSIDWNSAGITNWFTFLGM